MIISEIKTPHELATIWNSTRKKDIRFQILSNSYCPNNLIYKALFLYDPEKVLSIPAVSVKYMWLLDDSNENEILKDCLDLLNNNLDDTPKGYKYNFAKDYNLLYYLECVYAQTNSLRQVECIVNLNSRAYLERLLKRTPNVFTNLLREYCIDSQTNVGAGIYTHLYAKKFINFSEFKELCEMTFDARKRGLIIPCKKYIPSIFWTTVSQVLKNVFKEDRVKTQKDLQLVLTEVFNIMTYDESSQDLSYSGLRLHIILRHFEERVKDYDPNISSLLRVWFGSKNYHGKPL